MEVIPLALPAMGVSGGSLVSASSLWVPDCASTRRPSGSSMAPSSLISTVAHQSTGSSLQFCLGLSSTIRRLRTQLLRLHLVPLSVSGSSFPLATLWSSVSPAPLWPSGSSPAPLLPEPSAPPWPSGYSPPPWLIVSPSLPRAPPPPASLALVGPLELSARSPPWLLPLSAPPWAAINAGVWVLPGSSCSLLSLALPSNWSAIAPPVSFMAPLFIVSSLDSVWVHPPPPNLHLCCPPPVLPALCCLFSTPFVLLPSDTKSVWLEVIFFSYSSSFSIKCMLWMRKRRK